MNKGRRLISILTVICIIITTVASGSLYLFAADSGNVYVKQDGSGKCTLASAVMMMRQKALNEGNSTWSNITQSSAADAAWLNGVGLKHSFTYCGISVSYKDFTTETAIKSQLISLLDKHREGIEIYDRSVPHAVLLTRYDASTDTFYCADPALSTSEMTLENSWMSTIHKNLLIDIPSVQDAIINSLDAYWYITSYTYKEIPVYVKPVTDSTATESVTPSVSNGSIINDTLTVNDSENNVVSPDTGSNKADADIDSDDRDDTKDSDSGNKVSNSTILSSSEESMAVKFQRMKDFAETQFNDLNEKAWYYEYIESAYEMGLMNGMTETEFVIDGNVTIAQTITLAARVHSLYIGDGYSFAISDDEEWYEPYVDYAYKKDVISAYYTKDSLMNKEATRAQFAEIMAASVDHSALKKINSIEEGSVPDVDANDETGAIVYELYKAGILTGSDEGNFYPDNKINRAQVAAILVRIADSDMRVKL